MPQRALTLDELGQHFEALAAIAAHQIQIGVGDAGAARYARALEFGSVAGQLPWPRPGARTTLAVDPHTGAQVVVSVQAPQGFIRVQAPAMRDALLDELASSADWLDAGEVAAHLDQALRAAAVAALQMLRSAAPRDSGRLAESFTLLES